MIHLDYLVLFNSLFFSLLSMFLLFRRLSRIVKTTIQNRKFTILDAALLLSYIVKL